MTPEIVNPIVELGAALSAYAVKGTVSSVSTKVKAIKTEKDIEKIRNSYDEIISELLEEREELIRIAQAYRSELDRIEISDEDIIHLHKTIESVLSLLAPLANLDDETILAFNTLKDIINVDTLKTIQLLGFNYKDAIGIPLTNLCANAINNIGKKQYNKRNNK